MSHSDKKLDFKSINFINLHAHSEYSLQDGVGTPRDHYVETIRKGHCGCAITDHGSYVSAFELYLLKDSHKKDSEVKELLKETGRPNHPIVTGAELYIYDDITEQLCLKLIEHHSKNKISTKTFLSRMQRILNFSKKNDRFSSLFSEESKFQIDLMVDDKKSKPSSAKERVGEALQTDIKKFLIQENLAAPEQSSLMDIESSETETTDGKSKKSKTRKPKSISLEDIIEDCRNFAKKTTACNSYKYNHITLMAKNEVGHSNLCHLTSIGSLPENYYRQRPRIRLSDLFKFKDGLMATSGCFIGMIPQAIIRKTGEADKYVKMFTREFGEDFYIEMHISDISMKWNGKIRQFEKQPTNPQAVVNDGLLELIEKYKLHGQTYITQDSHMPKKEDKEHQDLMILSDKNNNNGWHFYDAYYIMTVEEMYEKFRANCPNLSDEIFVQWCENSIKALNKTKDFKIDQSIKLVDFKPEEHDLGKDFRTTEPSEAEMAKINSAESVLETVERMYPNEYYVKKVLDASKTDKKIRLALRVAIDNNKFDIHDRPYRDALFEQLNIYQLNGYYPMIDYFMLIEKFSRIVREAGELVGQGRGSAAASTVCYALDITNTNPIKRNLLPERFLPKERIGMYYMDFKSRSLDEFKRNKYPNGLEVSLLEYPSKLEEFLKTQEAQNRISHIPAKLKNNFEKEVEFALKNPEIIDYFITLQSDNFSAPENDNNSLLAYVFGLAPLSEKNVTEEVGSVPDIDYDSSCRNYLIKKLVEMYGQNRVVLVGSYGKLELKSSVLSILKLKTDLTPQEQFKISEMFGRIKFSEEEKDDDDFDVFEESIARSFDLQKFFKDRQELKNQMKKILGTKKNATTHAAGVLVFEKDLTFLLPCRFDPEMGVYVTELDKNLCGSFGFVKMDLLGLSTLEELRDVFNRIKEVHGVDLFNKKDEIIYSEDKKIHSMFARRKTNGIFQFGPEGPTEFLAMMKKEPVFNDYPIITSAKRPGPMLMQMDKLLLKIIRGEVDVSYDHPLIEPILKRSYGIIVFQEQVMQIYQVIGGGSAYESDVVRKAMGSKKFKLLEPYRVKFLKNAIEVIGMEPERAALLWEKMAKFAEYGFNEAHAVSYAELSFLQMWVKGYYELLYVTTILSRANRDKKTAKDKDNFKKFYREYRDKILTPDINLSKNDYVLQDEKIMPPLFAINGVNEEQSKKIASYQPYANFKDMVLKFRRHSLGNKASIIALIMSGACDSFRPNIMELKKKAMNDELSLEDIEDLKSVCENNKAVSDTNENVIIADVLTKFDVGIPLEEEEINQFFDTKALKKGFNKYEYRKRMVYQYLYKYKQLEINNAVLEVIPQEKIDIAEYRILSGDDYSKVLMDICQDSINSEKLNEINQKVAKNGLVKTINTTSKGFLKETADYDEIKDLSNGKMILEELNVLKATSYNYDAIVEKPVNYFKESLLRNREVFSVSQVYKESQRFLHHSGEAFENLEMLRNKIYRNQANIEDVNLFGGNLLELRAAMGDKYNSRDIANNLLSPINFEETELREAVALNLFLVGGFDLITGVNEKVVVRLGTVIDKKIFNLISEASHQKELNLEKINTELKIEFDYFNYCKLISVLTVVVNGGALLKHMEKIGVSQKSTQHITATIFKIGVDAKNVETYRNALSVLLIKIPTFGEMVEILKMNRDVELGMNPFPDEIYVYGTSFKPEDKKKFIKEKNRKGRIVKDMSFTLCNNVEEFDVKVYDAEGYSINFNGQINKLQDLIENFHPIILKVKVKFDPIHAKMNLILGRDKEVAIPLIHQI